MLDHQTTMSLIARAKKGDEAAKQLLLEHNMPLIKSIAKRYRNKQTEYEDLIQLGSLGFVKAVNHFDEQYQVRFSTYAVPMIAGEIKRFIRDDGAVKVSRVLKSLSQKIQQYIQSYTQEHECSPDTKTIAKHFDMDEQEIVYAMDSSKYPVSLFETYDDDASQCVMDKLASPENSEDVVDKILLRDMIASLSERERKVIILRYYRDKTQSEIAGLLGVSQVQISRIESKILSRMRQAMA